MMKRILFTVLLLSLFLGTSSQNILHYAQTANGEKGKSLFPEGDDGKVFFSEIISVYVTLDTCFLVFNDLYSES